MFQIDRVHRRVAPASGEVVRSMSRRDCIRQTISSLARGKTGFFDVRRNARASTVIDDNVDLALLRSAKSVVEDVNRQLGRHEAAVADGYSQRESRAALGNWHILASLQSSLTNVRECCCFPICTRSHWEMVRKKGSKCGVRPTSYTSTPKMIILTTVEMVSHSE